LPRSHVRQMAAYAAALGVIFPDRRIEAGLLYTAGPRLFMIDPEVITAMKPGLDASKDNLSAPY
jgi:ATP-dependent helicase/nuclease subunit A